MRAARKRARRRRRPRPRRSRTATTTGGGAPRRARSRAPRARAARRPAAPAAAAAAQLHGGRRRHDGGYGTHSPATSVVARARRRRRGCSRVLARALHARVRGGGARKARRATLRAVARRRAGAHAVHRGDPGVAERTPFLRLGTSSGSRRRPRRRARPTSAGRQSPPPPRSCEAAQDYRPAHAAAHARARQDVRGRRAAARRPRRVLRLPPPVQGERRAASATTVEPQLGAGAVRSTLPKGARARARAKDAAGV